MRDSRSDRDREREQRDLLMFLLILLLGFICLLITAQMAVRPDLTWQVSADMSSKMDPDEDYDTGWARIEPLRPEVMTPPSWDPKRILTPTGMVIVIPPMTLVPLPTSTPTPREAAQVPTPSPSATSTLRTPTPTPTSTPTPTPTPTPRPTDTPTPAPTPTDTPAPTSMPVPPSRSPTYTPTPTETPTPTNTPTPTETPTPTNTPTSTATPTPTPVPHPSVFSITPDQGVNSAPVPVVIRGADFFGMPTAWLGTSVSIAIFAATADTLTGTVPAGVTPGVYALTVRNPDGRSGTLSPAYTVLGPPSADTTLERGYVSTFGAGASGAYGDDDHVQVIFFEVPASCADTLYIRIFDADTGGLVDEQHGGWNTTVRYTLRGGSGAYTTPDARSSHPGSAGINSGTLLAQTVIGNDPTYDNNWAFVLGPCSVGDGESVGGSRVFKLVVEGVGGDDGDFYNAILSSSSSSNVTPAGSRVFAYSWTFPLASGVSQRPSLYPYVPAGTASFEQHNWDMDYTGGSDTMTLHTPVQDIVVPASGISGNDSAATSAHSVGDGERGATWAMTLEFSSPSVWNDVTFWTVGDGIDLAIFTCPTTGPPP